MTEAIIRAKTDLLFKAYEELTGASPMPCIGEFLEMRKSAVEELRALGTAEEPAAAIQVIQEKKSENRAERGALKVVREKTAAPPIVQQTPQKKESKKEEEPVLSDFELLKRAGDPWN